MIEKNTIINFLN